MKQIFLLSLFLIPLISFSQKTNRLHFKSTLIDTHNDVLSSAVLDGIDISHRVKEGHSDLVRWNEGGLDVQFFSVWTGDKPRTKEGFYNDAVQEILMLDTLVKKNPRRMVLARNYKDVKKGVKQHKLVALIGVEGGHMIEDDLKNLESLYDMGMRYLTLTWNNSTNWATSAMYETGSETHATTDSVATGIQSPRPAKKGLSDFGKNVVCRMNELGIIVDLSHTGEQTFYDAIATSTKPVMLSHSNAWALCPVFRNVNDAQIRAVAKNNGVICINFYSGFISRRWDSTQKYLRGNREKIVNEKWSLLDSASQRQYWRKFYDSTLDAARPTISEMVDHIDHIVKLVGDDYVGIGSDYDGVGSLPFGLEDVTTYPKITEELVRRGYSKSSIKKILGKNVLRVMKDNFL